MKRPKTVTVIMILATLLLGSLISTVHVDTDPENMLSKEEAVRVFHNKVKQEFSLHDVVVVGIVNEEHPDGVFNPATLKNIQSLTEYSLNLSSEKDPQKRVVTQNVIAPGTVDNIEQAGMGQVRFEWLMKEAPTSREGALAIRDNAMSNPLLKGTLVSEDGKALCIYLPITAKDFAYELRTLLLDNIRTLDTSNGDKFYITGLPVAEDTFGVEMFIQMAVSAPLAMLAIFILMFIFFKKINMIISPLIIAMVSVIATMGLLIGAGNTLHIMSSMIPIFLMPIAVVDSIHILSEFFDRYPSIGDRRKTLEHVMDQLFMPMFYTSLTSAAGFLSLALTPIPPVQVFGIFVAFGIMLAWLLTIIFVPAYIMMLKEESLSGFGAAVHGNKNVHSGFLSRHLRWLGKLTYNQSKLILAATLMILIVAAWGITKININDNPVKWFKKDHPIRVADKVLNHHFGGTYEAYLVLTGQGRDMSVSETAALINEQINNVIPGGENSPIREDAALSLDEMQKTSGTPEELFRKLTGNFEEKMNAANDADYEVWGNILDSVAQVKNRGQIFKQPEMLRYIEKLQASLVESGAVGKSNSVADVVKKVYQELYEANPEYYRIPDTSNAVAQSLISFQNSHKPDDLWHLVTPDYTKANIWVQLKSGDNQDMEKVIIKMDVFFKENPPPMEIEYQWAGLTYLNVVWQDKMVNGMLKSFMSSFVVVFIMMAFLFRSPLWGLLAMVPLSVTIAFIYGIIGIIGKDYDMPVAVLSSLTLGLAVDFAIHFLERSRMVYKKTGSWKAAIEEMFEEPARAITRNVIVIAIGFTPLLAAPLVPYQTVGVFLASIMAVSGVATMIILPALVATFEPWLFKKSNK